MNHTNPLTSLYLQSFEIAQINLALYCREKRSLCPSRKRMLKKEQAINTVQS